MAKRHEGGSAEGRLAPEASLDWMSARRENVLEEGDALDE
jgi:hypothetical protein